MRLQTRTAALLLLMFTAAAPAPSAESEFALYWAISREGQPAGFLLGTIHSEDPRVLDFPDRFSEELARNQVFAMEMVPDLPTLTRLTEFMHYQDGTTLESRIGTVRFDRLRNALRAYRVPDEWISRMKVWAAMLTLSMPPPRSGFFMDFSLSLRAAGAGLEVIGLETLEQQLSFLEDMPFEQQLMLLDQALQDYDKVERLHLEMIETYLTGDLGALRKQAEEHLGQLDPATRAYFIEQGIDARNHRMLEALLPQLSEGTVFVAVGALHLPGKTGLVQLLRDEGYDLQPLPLPLSPAQ